jgi:hypothetical protein
MDFTPKSIYYPIESVRKKYEQGELALLEKRLIGFLERHKNEITEGQKDDSSLLESALQFILAKKTIHPPSEMAEQIQEICKEVWYRGEEGVKDDIEVKQGWLEKYAGPWREARLYEIQFLMREKQTEMISLLKS